MGETSWYLSRTVGSAYRDLRHGCVFSRISKRGWSTDLSCSKFSSKQWHQVWWYIPIMGYTVSLSSPHPRRT